MTNGKFYGKFRGTVINNVDPQQIGRVQVTVPDISIIPGTWAMPSFPVTGKQMGVWALPQIGTGVWVEFEGGELDYPIWTGCWYGSVAEVPALALATAPAVPNIVMQTQLQHTFMISDMPGVAGGFLLKTTTGAMISVSDVGIIISNGKGAMITLTGPTVSINNGAMTIT